MRAVLAVLAALLLVGCVRPGPTPTSSTPVSTVNGLEHYIVDPEDPQIDDVYDILAADFKELNGSVVLQVTMRDVDPVQGLPRILAIFNVEANDTTFDNFARSEPDLNKPAPHIRWEMGRVTGTEFQPRGEICTFQQAEKPPYFIQMDLLNNWTDLVEGGQITRLHLRVSNFENDTVLDSAEMVRTFVVAGSANPYDTCPLLAERPR